MAYTQTDLDNIDQAILKMGLGKRKGSVSIDGIAVQLSEVSLSELRELRSVIAESVSPAYSPRTYAGNGGRG